jgi:hypothetical protein
MPDLQPGGSPESPHDQVGVANRGRLSEWALGSSHSSGDASVVLAGPNNRDESTPDPEFSTEITSPIGPGPGWAGLIDV